MAPPIPIHATPEQTNMILRGGKKKKHMKNSKKNITVMPERDFIYIDFLKFFRI